MNPVIKADDDGADVLSGPDTVIFIQNFYTGIVNVETPDTLGGARLKFLGSITPTNLQPQMIMDYGQVDDTTRINMYSLSSEFFIEGPLISSTGDGVLVYADASDTALTFFLLISPLPKTTPTRLMPGPKLNLLLIKASRSRSRYLI